MKNNKCEYCEKLLDVHINRLTKDHIVPKSKGGTYDNSNIAYTCMNCNHFKGNSLPYDFINFLEMKIRHGKSLGIFTVAKMEIIRNNLISILVSRNVQKVVSNKKGWLVPLNKKELSQQNFITNRKKNKVRLNESVKKVVGHLNLPIKIKDCFPADVGSPVYEFDEDRFVVYLKKNKPITHDVYQTIEVRYYKTSLNSMINFVNNYI